MEIDIGEDIVIDEDKDIGEDLVIVEDIGEL